MARQTWKIFKYEVYNLLRSKWVILFGAFLLVVTEILLRFGGHPGKTIISLMNVMVLMVPLLSLILGVTYFYNSREFIELLLSQPITRTSIFLGKLLSLVFSLSLVLGGGLLFPFLYHRFLLSSYFKDLLALLFVGISFIFIFVSLSFLIASLWEDRVKGLGTLLILWLFLALLYDGGLLMLIYLFQDYPFERALVWLIMLNPIDLGRVLIMMRLDIAALMGHTGAIFQKFFGTSWGMGISMVSLLLWAIAPLGLGIWHFKRKDF